MSVLEASSAGCCCQLPGFNPGHVGWGLSHSPVQGCSGGCLLHMWVCVLCEALGMCKEGREAGCILELGAEEEDGFSDVLLANWVVQEGFGVFLTP